MTKNWIYSIGASSLLTLALHSWGNWREQAQQTANDPPPMGDRFPLSPTQGWFVEESYLILKPHEDNIWYAAKQKREGSAGNYYDFNLKKKTPDFGWYSGVRINIGRYLEHHDLWDISLTTTYYYASSEDTTHADLSQGTSLVSRWATLIPGPMDTASVVWRLNYFTWDLSIARFYQMTQKLSVHPLIGLRAAYISQSYHDRSSGSFDHFTGKEIVPYTFYEKLKATNNQWGIGPRMATNLQFNFGHRWYLLGTLGGSILLGSYTVKESLHNRYTKDGRIGAENDHIKESAYSVRANLEAAFGLGWEKWFRNRTVRLAPSFLFEATEWYDLNQFFEIRTESNPGDIALVKKIPPSGSLGLMGFSINLQADF